MNLVSDPPSLHVGPMSINAINAVVNFAEQNSWPICLIASRRQIDAQQLGGGYVGNFSTEVFANNLRDATKKGHVILARDHGGPYQRREEEGLSLEEAIHKAIQSYKTDIKCGFRIIHIDPEKCIKRGDPEALNSFINLTIELLGECFSVLDESGKNDVYFEIGSDEGVGMDFTPPQWEKLIEDVGRYCDVKGRARPIAIAVPLGTKVKEVENVGGLSFDINDVSWTERVLDMKSISDALGIKLKLHNADYISSIALRKLLSLGVEQINIAPQLGVVETRALVKILREQGLEKYANAFLKISYDSSMWERWLKADSSTNYEEKAIISGHYVLSSKEFIELKKEIESQIDSDYLEANLIKEITKVIKSYYKILKKNE